MGCCIGTPAGAGVRGVSQSERTPIAGPPANKQLAVRASTWKSTGIVALRDANLKALPQAVLDVGPSARTLDVTNNKLTELPAEVGNLINLQRLILGENRVERLPEELGSLISLKILALDSNRLRALPREVGSLARLERLSAAGNLLVTLPESLGKLTKLLVLDVSRNSLKELPPSVGGCSSLEELLASNNSLAQLPDSLCQLKQLKTLNLDQNKIAELPSALLVECRALQTLSLHGNPITHSSFEEMEGYSAFEGRRREKVDKQIAGNVMMTSKNLDEGVDRKR